MLFIPIFLAITFVFSSALVLDFLNKTQTVRLFSILDYFKFYKDLVLAYGEYVYVSRMEGRRGGGLRTC